ncbi:MAG: hypothetical protein NZM37_03245 [Sandaracinaceae bacterium]|nr:hypothetical protein [Sandaracinaceae bacterium]
MSPPLVSRTHGSLQPLSCPTTQEPAPHPDPCEDPKAPRFRDAQEVDVVFRKVVRAQNRIASLNGLPPEDSHMICKVAKGMKGVSIGAEILEPLIGPSLSAGFVGLVGAFVSGLCQIDHAWEGHHRRSAEVDIDRMKGALLYFLGRLPNIYDPKIHPKYPETVREGASRAAEFERHNPVAGQNIREAVWASFAAGERAALLNIPPSKLEQELRNPIFRMGYEEANALREKDPSAFEAKAKEAQALEEQFHCARRKGWISG